MWFGWAARIANLAGLVAGIRVVVLVLSLWVGYRVTRKAPADSYVVDLARQVLDALLFFTPSRLLMRILSADRSDGETDTLVLANLYVSVMVFLFVPAACELMSMPVTFALPLLMYGLWRVFETVLVEARVALVDTGPVLSYRRSAILALMNYVQIVFWFAFGYWTLARLPGPGHQSLNQFDALRISLTAMSLVAAETDLSAPALLQVTLGLFMSIVVLANAIGAIQRGEKGELERMLDQLKGKSITCYLRTGETISGKLRGFDDSVVLVDRDDGVGRRTALIPRHALRYIETTGQPPEAPTS